jgi:hypothetical protein
MISLKELLQTTDFNTLTKENQSNLMDLLEKVNKIRLAYGKPMTVTSCIRTKAKQIEVYKAKGITDLSKIPMNSPHISCEAADFSDPNGEIDAWVDQNQALLESLDMWQEHPDSTSNWCHLDIRSREQKSRPGCLLRQFKP